MKKLFLLTIFIAVLAKADLQKSIKSEYVDFSKIDLNAYLKIDPTQKTIEKMEPQEKDQPIMYVIFKKEKDVTGERQVLMHLFDFDRDGKIDLAKHFKNKIVIKTESSFNHDGKTDVVNNYDEQTGKLVQRIQSDGKTNIWQYFDDKGELRLKEIDRNSDKKPDMFIHYRNGIAVKTEVDVNYDGSDMRSVK